MKFQPYLRATIKGNPGISVELLRMDAVEESDLTPEELEVAEEEKDEASSTAIMRIYETIGEDFWTGGGITAKSFAEELDAFGEIKKLNLHINSLGGDVFTGQTIYNIVVDHHAKNKRTYIDGIAASAATIIASGAHQVIARENTNYMIHPPWMLTVGNAEDHRKAVELLEAITTPIVNVYKAQVKDKITEKKIRELMEDETWMTAQEALDYGFVDTIRGKVKAIAKINRGQILCSGRVMNLDRYQYRNVPRYPKMKFKAPEVDSELPKETTKKGKITMTREDVEPKLLAEIESNATAAERTRLEALDSMAAPGLEAIIAKAKATPGVQPKDIALECLNVTRNQLKQEGAMNALRSDAGKAGGIVAGEATPHRIPKPVSLEKQGVNLIVNAYKKLGKAVTNGAEN